MTGMRGFNVACHVEDFSSEDLRSLLKELYPDEARSSAFPLGVESQETWGTAMAVRTLREAGALRRDGRLLVLGAAAIPVVSLASRSAAEVVVADLFLGMTSRDAEEALLMLASPESFARTGLDPSRVTVRHMDDRVLVFPDESFDGVVASASMGRSGRDEDVAAAAYEIGRVLRPGGVATLTLDLLVMGPAREGGAPGRRLFAEPDLRRLVVDASGLEPLDELDLSVSARTLETPRDMEAILEDRPRDGRFGVSQLVAVHEGQVVATVHLGLAKGSCWPAVDNAWAAPSEALRVRVRTAAEDLVGRLLAPPPASVSPGVSAGAGSLSARPAPVVTRESLQNAFDAWEAVRARTALTAPARGPFSRRLAGFLSRTAGRVRDLGILGERERDLLRALIARQDELDQRLRELLGRGDR